MKTRLVKCFLKYIDISTSEHHNLGLGAFVGFYMGVITFPRQIVILP